MTQSTEQERAEFEAWARDRYPSIDLTRDRNDYSKALAKDYWSLWQAARRAPAVPTRKQIEQYLYEQGAVTVSRDVAEAAGLARLAGKMQSAPAVTVPQFNHSAKRKLNYLLEAGETITGYAFQNKDGRRGSIDCHGFVAWWHDAAAPQPPEADHIPDAGKMDTNVRNWMNAALSKDVACPACGLSGLHACPSASTAESQGADAVTALEKVLRAVQRHLPPERIGERETIAEIISIVDPWPLGKPPVPWKDHMTAELVGKLTDVARQFHGTQQLRERIAGLLRPLCERIKQFDGDRMPEVDMGNPISAAAPVQLPGPQAEIEVRSMKTYLDLSIHEWRDILPDGTYKIYTEQQVRELLAARGIKVAP